MGFYRSLLCPRIEPCLSVNNFCQGMPEQASLFFHNFPHSLLKSNRQQHSSCRLSSVFCSLKPRYIAAIMWALTSLLFQRRSTTLNRTMNVSSVCSMMKHLCWDVLLQENSQLQGGNSNSIYIRGRVIFIPTVMSRYCIILEQTVWASSCSSNHNKPFSVLVLIGSNAFPWHCLLIKMSTFLFVSIA